MDTYRKKPVVIKAEQWTGDFTPELLEALQLSGHRFGRTNYGDLLIDTLEGPMRANKGDYIIFGVSGEPYPCKPDIFLKTYEKVGEEGRK